MVRRKKPLGIEYVRMSDMCETGGNKSGKYKSFDQ